jgi:hypothetical protein
MKNNLFRKIIGNSEYLTSAYLVILSVGAIMSRTSGDSEILVDIVINLLIVLSICLVVPYLISYYSNKKISFFNGFITSLILFLLIDPREEKYVVFIIALGALVFRLIFRYRRKPILNPAVSGILIVVMFSLFFEKLNPFISWWGVSFAPRIFEKISIAALLTIIIGIYLARKTAKRYVMTGIIFAFLLVVFLNIFFSKSYDLVFLFLDGTFVFAVLVMLSEPKTSPIRKNQQIIYSLVFAVVWGILFYLNEGYAIIYAIFAANIFNLLNTKFLKKYLK